MSDENKEPKRSKNMRNGLSSRRNESLGKCVKCDTIIPTVISVLRGLVTLPNVLIDIINQYINNTQYIGYVILHTPTRRTNHAVCIACHEFLVNVCLQNGDNLHECPIALCNRRSSVLEIEQNVLG
jgi:hypothetical protein